MTVPGPPPGQSVRSCAMGPRWRLAAFTLVGLLAVVVIAAVTADDDAAPPPTTRAGPAAAEAFLDTWRASREGTWQLVTSFTRTSNSTGAELTDRIEIVQRPPDRLTLDRDGAVGLVDGRRVYCTYRDEALDCEDARARRSYQEGVDEQLRDLASNVTGADPLYEVTAATEPTTDAVCFTLALTRSIVAPPLGTRARYCFDRATAVPVSTSIERPEADDEFVTLTRSTTVTDEDLAVIDR